MFALVAFRFCRQQRESKKCAVLFSFQSATPVSSRQKKQVKDFIPSPVTSFTSVFLHLTQKLFYFFFCSFNGYIRRMHRTLFTSGNLLVCKTAEIIQHQPSFLDCWQSCNGLMQLFIGEFPHDHFFYRAWLVQRMGGECFFGLVGQVIVPVHLIEKRQIV